MLRQEEVRRKELIFIVILTYCTYFIFWIVDNKVQIHFNLDLYV